MTDRTKLEQEQEHEQALSLRLFDTLFASAPFGFAFFDRDLRFVRINEQLAEINGYSVAAHLGKIVAEIAPTLDATAREVTARILATGQPVLDHEASGESARAPGVTRHWNTSWYPVQGERGETVGFSAVVVDITERKQAEAALRENEERLRLAIAGSDLGSWHWDLRTRALEWSERCLAIFGIPARTAMSYEKFLGALHPEDRARTDDAVQRALQDGSEYRIEFRSVWPDGSVHWAVSLGRAYYDAAGVPTRMEGIAIDITERKHAEAALRESERHYRALAEASSEIAYRMSADWSTMLPLDGRELVASSSQPLTDWAWLDQNVPPDEHPRVRQAISEAITRKSLFELEHRVRRPDGSIGWTLSRAVPMLDDNGAVTAWFGVASDITERKQAEAALRASEARLRRVFESNVVGMIRWDVDRSLILDANAEFLRMTGYVRDDITSGRLNFRDLTPPEWTARNEEGIRAIRANGHAPPYEKEYFQKDGSRLPIIIAGTRFEDSPSEGMSFLIDLTEMKQAEALLRERTELLNGVLEGTTDVIFVKDLNGRLLLANAAFAAAARSTPEQLVGKTDEDWFPPDVAAAVRQQDEALIAGGAPIQFEETVPVAGEGRVFLTLKAPLRDGRGRVVGILGIGRDITERKRIELNLIETTAVAEKANRAKSDFLSSMSHELRTPLNAILGFAQLMESSTPPPTPAQSRGLDQILKGGWYLLELINELLDLAQIESGKLSVTQEPVSLAEVMRECQDMLEPQARTRGIRLIFPSLEFRGYARADRTRVKQVMLNILSNAIKYNNAQGAVTVEVSLSSPDAIRVSVRDTGEGLAPEQLAQLFQPFNRLGRQAGPEQGTGIGLVMSRRLVELMGGTMDADSAVGVGSVFWFELRWVSASPAARE